MKDLTQEELLYQLDEMTGRRYMDFPWSVKDRQAYDQLKEIVEEHFGLKAMQETEHLQVDNERMQKPTVTREWVEQAWKETVNRFDLGYTSEFLFIKQLKEIGVEVINED